MPDLYEPIALADAVGPGFANDARDLARLGAGIEARSGAAPFAGLPDEDTADTGGVAPGYLGATQAFQIATGNDPDGVVLPDGQTLKALNAGESGFAPIPKVKATVGSRGPNRPDDVAIAQAKHARIGYAPGVLDPGAPGYRRADPATVTRANRAFQRTNGLEVDGYMTPDGETERAVDAQIGRARHATAEALEQATDETVRRASAGDPALKGVTNRAAARSVAGLHVGQTVAAQKTRRLRTVSTGGGLSVVRTRRPMRAATAGGRRPGRPSEPDDPKPRLEAVADKPDGPSSDRGARPPTPPPYPRQPDEIITVNGVTLFRRTFDLYNRVLTATPETVLGIYEAVKQSDLPLRQKGVLFGLLNGIEDGKRPSAAEVAYDLKELRADEHLADRYRKGLSNYGPGRARRIIRWLIRRRRPPISGRPPQDAAPGSSRWPRIVRDAPPPAKLSQHLQALVRRNFRARSRPLTGNAAIKPDGIQWNKLETRPKISQPVHDLRSGWLRVDPSTIMTADEFNRRHAPAGEIDPNRIGTVQNGVSQKKIHVPLADGSTVGLTLAEYVAALRSGAIKPSDVEPIKLYELNGRVISMDNRRLVAARLAGVKVRYTLLGREDLKPEVKKVDKTWSLHEIWIRDRKDEANNR